MNRRGLSLRSPIEREAARVVRAFGESYFTEKDKLEGGQLKKYGEIRERLDIEWELKGLDATAKESPGCSHSGTKRNSKGEAEFSSGKMEGELEEVTLKRAPLAGSRRPSDTRQRRPAAAADRAPPARPERP